MDIRDALSFGMDAGAAEAYADRCAAFDVNSLRLTAVASGVPLYQLVTELQERVAHLEAVLDQPGVCDYLDAIARGDEGVVR